MLLLTPVTSYYTKKQILLLINTVILRDVLNTNKVTCNKTKQSSAWFVPAFDCLWNGRVILFLEQPPVVTIQAAIKITHTVLVVSLYSQHPISNAAYEQGDCWWNRFCNQCFRPVALSIDKWWISCYMHAV